MLPGLIAVALLCCAWSVVWVVVLYVRRETRRKLSVAEAARLEGVTLALRTVRHHLGNRLAVTLGYSELLADDPRLPEDLEEQAQLIMRSAKASVDVVDKLQKRIVRVRLDASVAGPALLDLDASASPIAPSADALQSTLRE